jgi:hypothetical protein
MSKKYTVKIIFAQDSDNSLQQVARSVRDSISGFDRPYSIKVSYHREYYLLDVDPQPQGETND